MPLSSVWFAALIAAHFNESPTTAKACTLTVDKPVHKLGASAPIRFILKNTHATAAATLSSNYHWAIWQEGMLVFAPPAAANPEVAIAPGGQISWEWSKVDKDGQPVSPGSYTIHVGKLAHGTSTYSLEVDVAITTSGRIAGTQMFPLGDKNEWEFESWPDVAPSLTVRMTQIHQQPQWYRVQGLLGTDFVCRATGGPKPKLYAIASESDGPKGRLLFRFKEKKNLSYSVNASLFGPTKITVAATDDALASPVGDLTKCYRLMASQPQHSSTGFTEIAFAPGIGIVDFTAAADWKGTYYRLRRARIRGIDGQMYSIGQR